MEKAILMHYWYAETETDMNEGSFVSQNSAHTIDIFNNPTHVPTESKTKVEKNDKQTLVKVIGKYNMR